MDETWFWSTAPMGGLMVLYVVALAQFDTSRTAKFWAASWGFIYLDTLIYPFAATHLAFEALAQWFGLAFAGAILAGAFEFGSHQVRLREWLLWLLPGTGVILAMMSVGGPQLSTVIGFVQGPMIVAAGVLVWRAHAEERSFVQRLLSFALIALGLNEAVDMFIIGAGYSVVSLGIWIALAQSAALLEISSLARRARLREEHVREERDRALRQADRLEAVTTLAGGVAHEFNNQLTTILGNLELFDGKVSERNWRSSLADIRQAAQRCADVTASLLTFSDRNDATADTIDVRNATRDVLRVLELNESTDSIVISFSSELQAFQGSPSDFRFVLTSLLANARDASGPGGRIELAFNVWDDTRARFEVRDSGPGMDSDTARQVFDPFFSLKDVGRSCGLSLSTSYGIVEAHGGKIGVDTWPGKGATFWVLWPMSPQPT